MLLIKGLHKAENLFPNGCVATIGNYDGIHLGHQKIIHTVKEKALMSRLPALVITFEPYPRELFGTDRQKRLTGLREKLVLLRDCGIDVVLLLSFNLDFASIPATQFINEILVNCLRVKHLVVGDDFEFGYKRGGNFSLLMQADKQGKFKVVGVSPVKVDGMRVSSSSIRSALLHGDLLGVTKFFGREYSVCGRVVHGDGLGKNLGFPTANIRLKNRDLLPLGVYIVRVHNLIHNPLYGLANVGFRPTVRGKDKLLEVYILDFDADIYGKLISLEFCSKIRDEKKFSSLSELRQQIELDVIMARKALAGYAKK